MAPLAEIDAKPQFLGEDTKGHSLGFCCELFGHLIHSFHLGFIVRGTGNKMSVQSFKSLPLPYKTRDVLSTQRSRVNRRTQATTVTAAARTTRRTTLTRPSRNTCLRRGCSGGCRASRRPAYRDFPRRPSTYRPHGESMVKGSPSFDLASLFSEEPWLISICMKRGTKMV